MIRPISLYPFPNEAFESINPECRGVLSVEMSAMGQLLEDVKLSLNGSMPTYYHGRSGGMVPTPDEIVNKVKEILGGDK